MKEYYFLFAITFLWTLFATVQDIKKREVANWLNFSLIAIALAYRSFYSISTKNPNFFILGVLGFAIFFLLANALYYTRAIAGGDAKLLMAYGIILPYQNYFALLYLPIAFLLLLFLVGSIYSLLYSTSIVAKNKQKFKKQFFSMTKKFKFPLIIPIILSMLFLPINKNLSLLTSTITLFSILFIYTKSLDKCMVKLTPPNKLTEGDWLVNDIILPRKTIKKTVHGLSLADIKFIKKANRSVLIKTGIPFVPAFLITLILMALFFLISPIPLSSFLPF